MGPTVSDPVPILQPPTASVSDYARRIELLAQDLSNGSALKPNANASRRSASPDSSGGYYTPPSVQLETVTVASTSKKSSAESSQRNRYRLSTVRD